MEETGFLLLLLNLVVEVPLVHIYEVNGFLELCLSDEHFQIEVDKLLVGIEIGLFHQFQEEEVGDVKDFGLELEVDAD